MSLIKDNSRIFETLDSSQERLSWLVLAMRRRRESEDWLAHSCATQIQLAEKREQVISVEKVDKDIRAIVREIRRRFGALAPLIAAEVVGDTDLAVSQVKIDRALKGALEALSQFDPDDESVRDVLISTKTNSSH